MQFSNQAHHATAISPNRLLWSGAEWNVSPFETQDGIPLGVPVLVVGVKYPVAGMNGTALLIPRQNRV